MNRATLLSCTLYKVLDRPLCTHIVFHKRAARLSLACEFHASIFVFKLLPSESLPTFLACFYCTLQVVWSEIFFVLVPSVCSVRSTRTCASSFLFRREIKCVYCAVLLLFCLYFIRCFTIVCYLVIGLWFFCVASPVACVMFASSILMISSTIVIVATSISFVGTTWFLTVIGFSWCLIC